MIFEKVFFAGFVCCQQIVNCKCLIDFYVVNIIHTSPWKSTSEFLVYDFVTKSVENIQNLKCLSDPSHKMWECHLTLVLNSMYYPVKAPLSSPAAHDPVLH